MLGEAPYPWFVDVWDRFGQSLAQSRLGHAVLIVGPAGVGKLALADSLTLSGVAVSGARADAGGTVVARARCAGRRRRA